MADLDPKLEARKVSFIAVLTIICTSLYFGTASVAFYRNLIEFKEFSAIVGPIVGYLIGYWVRGQD